MSTDALPQAIAKALTQLQIAKCTCGTKTNAIGFHDPRCTYRLAIELEHLVEVALDQLRTAVQIEHAKVAKARNACLAVIAAVEGTDTPVDGRRFAYALLDVLRGHDVVGTLHHHGIAPDEPL